MDKILLLVLIIGLMILNHKKSLETCQYLLYTKRGIIECAYHNSRDIHNGFIEYYSLNGKRNLIKYQDIDSVMIIRENFLFSGPHNQHLKYINLTK